MTPVDAFDGATFCEECGRENCEGHESPDAPSAPRLTRWALDLLHDPAPTETIEGVAWAGLLTVLVSESGAGKTFMLVDLAGAVSAGVPWHGRTTRHGTVAYCSFEGDALGLRLRAFHHHVGHRLDNLAVIRLSDPISPRLTRDGEVRSIGEDMLLREIDALEREIAEAHRPPLALVVVDTVRASMAGSEDSSEAVSAYLRVARRVLARVPQAGGILAHHAGWMDGETKRKREHGSSSWRGNVDATLYLEAGEYDRQAGTAPLTLSALKVRDTERPAPLHLIRRQVTLNERDARGQPVTSCVIDQDRRTPEDREAAAIAIRERQQQEADLQTLRAIVDHPDAATSLDRLRLQLGVRKAAVAEALSRLLNRQWVALPTRQRQPYTVTEAGIRALEVGK
jgi:AAA domain-containing protein